MTRDEARAAGLKRYASASQCKHLHAPVRYVSTNACVACILSGNSRPHHLLSGRKWVAKNRERALLGNTKWREANREKHKALIAKWKEENKGRLAESVRFRQARKRQAAPKWLTPEQRAEMQYLYEMSALLSRMGWPTHVDHIVPLRGKTICGLHVPWNLRLLSAKDNLAKGSNLQ